MGTNSWNGRELNHLLLNRGAEGFVEVGEAFGLAGVADARGMAAADFDHDGDVDILVNNYRAKAALYQNQGAGSGFLALRLRGTRSNRDAVGAEVVVSVQGRELRRLVSAGQSYASQFSLEQLVGLGTATSVDDVRVRWPNGVVESFGPAQAGLRLTLVEGTGTVAGHLPTTPEPERSQWWILVALLAGLAVGALALTGRRRV